MPNERNVLTLYECAKCGRRAFAALAIPPGHGYLGERCGGAVSPVDYVALLEIVDRARDGDVHVSRYDLMVRAGAIVLDLQERSDG